MGEFAFQKDEKPEISGNSSEEIQKLENELKEFYKKRMMFLILGFVAIIVGIGVAAISFTGIEAFISLGSSIIAGGIALFILRSALFNTRIRNRRERIKYLKEQGK